MTSIGRKPWVIGMTGASGAIYGAALIRYMLSQGHDLHLVFSDAAWRVIREELGWAGASQSDMLAGQFSGFPGSYKLHSNRDIGASIASGSFLTEGMVVIPCSMGTLSGIARGASDNLLKRAADVMLKEGRKLIIVPRETPLSVIHLENMLSLARLGVRIIPAMPAFYQHPATIDDIVAFQVGKVLDSMGIDHELFRRWGVTDEQP